MERELDPDPTLPLLLAEVADCRSEANLGPVKRKGGVFNPVPADHDVTNEVAAYKLADDSFPGYFGIFYKVSKPTKNAKEAGINANAQAKVKGLKDWQILQKSFERMR